MLSLGIAALLLCTSHAYPDGRDLHRRAPLAIPSTPRQDWQYQGCISDSVASRTLSSDGYTDGMMTNEACVAYCHNKNFIYAATEYSRECFCGNTLNVHTTGTDTECSMPCAGKETDACGGSNRMTLYMDTTVAPPPAPKIRGGVGGWGYIGCYTDGYPRALSFTADIPGGSSKNSVAACTASCQANNFIYASMEYGAECYCGNEITAGYTLAPDGECNMLCSGSPEYCGAGFRMSTYKLGAPDPFAPRWMSMGCYTDTVAARSLSIGMQVIGGSANMTNENCQQACGTAGYTLSGTEYSGECFCDNIIRNAGAPAADGCTMKCNGDHNQFCGGPDRLNMWKFDVPAPSTSASSLASSTASAAAASSSAADGFGWSSQGCYTDSVAQRALRFVGDVNGPMTISLCQAACHSLGRRLAGLEYAGECWCDDDLQNQHTLAPDGDAQCNMQCKGDDLTVCGGANRLNLYAYGLLPSSVRSSFIALITTASVSQNASISMSMPASATGQSSIPLSSSSDMAFITSSSAMVTVMSSSHIDSMVNASSSEMSVTAISAISSMAENSTSSMSANSSSSDVSLSDFSITAASTTTSYASFSPVSAPNSTISVSDMSSSMNVSASGFSVTASPTFSGLSLIMSTSSNSMNISVPSSFASISSSINSSYLSESPSISTSSTDSMNYTWSMNITMSPTSTSASVSTVSSFSRSISAYPTGWQYFGCYTDNPGQRSLANRVFPAAGVKMTQDVCKSLCLNRNMFFAGVEYGAECYCDSMIRNNGAPASDPSSCNMACEGNSTMTCGAGDRLTLFQYLVDPTISSSAVSSPSALPNAEILAGWTYKGCWVDNYMGRGRTMGNMQPDDQQMTIASCVKACSGLGFPIAGMEYHYQCFCDKTLRMGAPIGVDSDCSTACAGNSTQMCGGPDRLTLYSSLNGTIPVLDVPQIQKTGLPGNYSYVGCLTDNNDARRTFPWQIVDDTENTPEKCLTQCAKYGYGAASLEYGTECYCGDASDVVDSGATFVPDDQCDFVCSGNATGYCGGPRLLAYYQWQGANLTTWHEPTNKGSYELLIGGVVIPLITTQGVNGKVTFLEKGITGAPNTTGAYELDLSLTGDYTKAWREMHVLSDMFCSASLTLPDKAGRQINIGGWSGGSTYGVRLYSPTGSAGVNGTSDWQENPDVLALQNGRWYPSAMMMANGSVLVVGGESGSNAPPVPTLELLPAVGAPLYMEWLERTDPLNLYPFLAVLPRGGILAGYFNEAIILDEITFATTRTLPQIPGNVNNNKAAGRTYPLEGSMVLLPQKAPYTDPFEILICGGSTEFEGAAMDNCVSIAPEIPNANWTIERMPSKRVMPCFAPLPDGTFLILNGAKKGVAGFGLAEIPNLDAVLYDPALPVGQRMSKMASTIVPRMYHSEAITLLDGRVLVTGSDPEDQTGTYQQEYRVEVFIPPYLSSGLARPQFTIPNKDWSYGQAIPFTVDSSSGGPTRVSLLGAVSSTHGNSMGQRTIFPQVSCSGGSCHVVAPPDAHVCPPGWFMMFVLDGPTPSVGQWVRIGNDPASIGNWPPHSEFYPLPGV